MSAQGQRLRMTRQRLAELREQGKAFVYWTRSEINTLCERDRGRSERNLEPRVIEFDVPKVRTLDDMTPAEIESLGAPLHDPNWRFGQGEW